MTIDLIFHISALQYPIALKRGQPCCLRHKCLDINICKLIIIALLLRQNTNYNRSLSPLLESQHFSFSRATLLQRASVLQNINSKIARSESQNISLNI